MVVYWCIYIIIAKKLILPKYFYNEVVLSDFSLKPDAGSHLRIFEGRERFLEYGHYDKHLIYNKRKKSVVGKNLEVLSPSYS